MYCLAMYPDILERLRREILTVVGKERNPTYDDIKEMKYLKAVLNGEQRISVTLTRFVFILALQRLFGCIHLCEYTRSPGAQWVKLAD